MNSRILDQVYQEGLAARRSGKTERDCPYSDQGLRDEWLIGWKMGD